MMEPSNQSPPPTISQGRSRRWIKRIAIFLVLGVALWGVVVAAMPQAVEVEVTEVSSGPFVVTVNEDGVSRIRDRYVISAPLAGTLARLELHPGDEVEQGRILARILPLNAPLLDARSRTEAEARVSAAMAGLRQTNAQIERARAKVEFAQKEADSTAQLAQRGTLSQLELDRARLEQRSSQAELTSAEFAAKVAGHELAMARSLLGRFSGKSTGEDEQFEITSPSTGRVLKVLQQSEGVVQAGTPLLELGHPKALEVAVDVLTSDAVEIHPGARVTLSGWGGPALDAVVRLVEPAAFTRLSALGVEEQRVNIIIDLTAPYESWNALGDGYRVEAGIEVYRDNDAVQVPWSSLFREGEHWCAFAVASGRAKKVPVEVGRRNETHAEIISGLSPGQRVIQHPSDRVADGIAVRTDP